MKLFTLLLLFQASFIFAECGSDSSQEIISRAIEESLRPLELGLEKSRAIASILSKGTKAKASDPFVPEGVDPDVLALFIEQKNQSRNPPKNSDNPKFSFENQALAELPLPKDKNKNLDSELLTPGARPSNKSIVKFNRKREKARWEESHIIEASKKEKIRLKGIKQEAKDNVQQIGGEILEVSSIPNLSEQTFKGVERVAVNDNGHIHNVVSFVLQDQVKITADSTIPKKGNIYEENQIKVNNGDSQAIEGNYNTPALKPGGPDDIYNTGIYESDYTLKDLDGYSFNSKKKLDMSLDNPSELKINIFEDHNLAAKKFKEKHADKIESFTGPINEGGFSIVYKMCLKNGGGCFAVKFPNVKKALRDIETSGQDGPYAMAILTNRLGESVVRELMLQKAAKEIFESGDYVGFYKGKPVLEVLAVDPKMGMEFGATVQPWLEGPKASAKNKSPLYKSFLEFQMDPEWALNRGLIEDLRSILGPNKEMSELSPKVELKQVKKMLDMCKTARGSFMSLCQSYKAHMGIDDDFIQRLRMTEQGMRDSSSLIINASREHFVGQRYNHTTDSSKKGNVREIGLDWNHGKNGAVQVEIDPVTGERTARIVFFDV